MSILDSLSALDILPTSSTEQIISSSNNPLNITLRPYIRHRRKKDKIKLKYKYELSSLSFLSIPKISSQLHFLNKNTSSISTSNHNLELTTSALLPYTSQHSTQVSNDPAPLLLAAGHFNQFFLYPNKHGQMCYILKVTSAREGQFYSLLHSFAKQPFKAYPTLFPLLGKSKSTSIFTEIHLFESLKSLATSQNSSEKNPQIFKKRSSLFYEQPTETNSNSEIMINISNHIESENQIFAKAFLNYTPKCFKTYSHRLNYYERTEEDQKSFKDVTIIKLINLNYNLKLPLILDIKMGRRLYGDDASKIKRERLSKKAEGRSNDTLGFSFSGMIGYNYREEQLQIYGGSRCFEGTCEGNPQTIEQYTDLVFYKFLCAFRSTTLSIKVGTYLCDQLEKILEIMERQKLIAFYGSSLLFVADTSLESTCDDIADQVKVRMIDFANVTLFSGKKDKDYVFGLTNLLIALKASIVKF